MQTFNLRSEGDLGASKRRLVKAVALLKKNDNGNPLALGEALAALGEVCLTQGRFEEAERALLEALDRCSHDRSEFTLLRSRLMKNLAKIYCERQDFEMAKTFLSEAMAANIRFFGPGHHAVREAMADLRSVVAAMYSLRSA